MRKMTALEAKNRFGQLIESAQRQPVTVTKQGRDSVVVMSMADYERRKNHAWRNVLKSMEDTSRYAAAQGLTEERLDQLLADES
ncbi:prevent-host-death family protein [Salinisphaera sp. PC39]